LKNIDVFASLEVYVYVLIVVFERKEFFKCITDNGTLSEQDNKLTKINKQPLHTQFIDNS